MLLLGITFILFCVLLSLVSFDVKGTRTKFLRWYNYKCTVCGAPLCINRGKESYDDPEFLCPNCDDRSMFL